MGTGCSYLAECGRLLADGDVMTGLAERNRCGQAAKPGADNDGVQRVLHEGRSSCYCGGREDVGVREGSSGRRGTKQAEGARAANDWRDGGAFAARMNAKGVCLLASCFPIIQDRGQYVYTSGIDYILPYTP